LNRINTADEKGKSTGRKYNVGNLINLVAKIVNDVKVIPRSSIEGICTRSTIESIIATKSGDGVIST